MSLFGKMFGKKEGLPGVPEFKGVKKPSKLESGKTPEELAEKLGVKKPEDIKKSAEDFDIDVAEEDEGEDITGEIEKLEV